MWNEKSCRWNNRKLTHKLHTTARCVLYLYRIRIYSCIWHRRIIKTSTGFREFRIILSFSLSGSLPPHICMRAHNAILYNTYNKIYTCDVHLRFFFFLSTPSSLWKYRTLQLYNILRTAMMTPKTVRCQPEEIVSTAQVYIIILYTLGIYRGIW